MANKNYWLNRVVWEGRITYNLLNAGLLSIGWSDFSTREFIEEVRKYGDKAIIKNMERRWGVVSRNRHNLKRFMCEMKAGDYVVVPKPYVYDVYEITDDEVLCTKDVESIIQNISISEGKKVELRDNHFYVQNTDQVIDIGFFRRIKRIELNIPRNDYSTSNLISAMKFRGTNMRITKYGADIDNAIERHKKGKPIKVHDEIAKSCADIILKYLQDFIGPDAFEEVVCSYFRKIGADVYKPSKNSKKEDYADADVVATFHAARLVVYVQVKHHKDKTYTSSWAIEQVSKWREQKSCNDSNYTTAAWVISTAKYNDNTLNDATDADVLLINGEEFAHMLLEAGIRELK